MACCNEIWYASVAKVKVAHTAFILRVSLRSLVVHICNVCCQHFHRSIVVCWNDVLSSDQLRAASLIGRNAVTWLCALSTVRRSSWHVIEYLQRVTRDLVTCRHMSRGRGWHVVNILRKWSHEFDSQPITKSNVIFCTLFLFTFCFVFVGLSY